jgi:hypothetical protein
MEQMKCERILELWDCFIKELEEKNIPFHIHEITWQDRQKKYLETLIFGLQK